MAIDTTTEVARAYYDSWKDGRGHFDAARLRSLLAPDLVFDGPLAGHRIGADGFLKGLADFADSVTSFQLVSEVRDGDQAAYLYDCDLVGRPARLRFAEFLRISGGRIQSITLLYDKADFLNSTQLNSTQLK